ncbi:hypothetical protein SAMN04487944_12214 [Gracilibacillus ureilyticus]|uniref:Uncharacterized protein n=1 Tax=Gracilibacillus ureilyticus TaxID=531814 RepID=A0A1H9V8B9_9BACI|nr:hypothetical protein [Gracilibacillus ureilyticus]SES17932.1 hypothetical protein SAMN04487944_12214 [Gracilibacillus ureilyticus]
MGNCCCGTSSSFSQNQFFSTQTEGSINIPFGVNMETTVLTLPVTTTFDLQNVKLDYAVQLAFSLAAGNPQYDYGVRARLRRDGILLVTQTLQQSGSRPGGAGASVRREHIPNTWADDEALAGAQTYTVTLEFFQRANANTTLAAETRSLNAIMFGL